MRFLSAMMLLNLALLGGPAPAHAQDPRLQDGAREDYYHDDHHGPGPGGLIDSARLREDAERFHRAVSDRVEMLRGRLQGSTNPNVATYLDQARELLSRARGELESGRPHNAIHLIRQADYVCGMLGQIPTDSQWGKPPGTPVSGSPESQRSFHIAFDRHKKSQDHLLQLRDRLSGTGDERLLGLIQKAQEMLDKCKESLSAGRPDAAVEFIAKAEMMIAEIHREAGRRPVSQEGNRRRLADRIQRDLDLLARRKSEGAAADRVAAAAGLLEQAQASHRSGNTEAAEKALTQAEKVLAQADASQRGNKLSSSSFDRLQGKLEKARSIVQASRDEKAVRILEKGLEHFAKAERYRSEGQKARAEAEVDIALKLAAKAVDIARSSGRR